jgi:hypothetical protein
MQYGIVINLNHDSHPLEVCSFLWEVIREHMMAAGFRQDGRMFVIDRSPEDACRLARETIDSIESHLEYQHRHLHKYLRDFYGFPLESRTNLLIPPIENIEVRES